MAAPTPTTASAAALLCLALSLPAALAHTGSALARCRTRVSHVPRRAMGALPRRNTNGIAIRRTGRRSGGGWAARAEAEEDPRAGLVALGYDPDLIESAKGSRWDAQNQRWIRDESAKWGDVLVRPTYGRPYVIWPAVYEVLVSKNLQSIPPAHAQEQMKNGAILLDIREDVEFQEYHASGASHVALFERLDPPNTPLGIFYKLGYALVGVTPTDYNPNFSQQVLRVAGSKDRPIIVYCGYGGYLDQTTKTRLDKYPEGYRDPERAFGWESRSLRAAFELINAGFSDVVHMEGGLGKWSAQGLGTER